jgi:nucleoside-diphosphate-sugar epimerase
MKILVTGATGFIGGEIASKLLSEKFKVIGLSRNKIEQKSELKILPADITNEEEVGRIAEAESFDAVIHCAGLAHQFGEVEKERFENVNVRGTRNILELAVKTKAKHFIFLSSTAVYGLQNNPMDESSKCNPENFYAESKLKAEAVCREICEKNNISLTIFRPPPVLGERGVGNVPRLIEAINKRRFFWIGNGENKKTLIYVGDIAEACLTLLKKKRNGTEIFNLASEPVKMRTLVSIISEKLKKTVPPFSIPASLPAMIFSLNSKTFKLKIVDGFAPTFEKWLSEDVYPADKIREDYGFEPKTPIEQAVRRQCDWFIQNSGSRT